MPARNILTDDNIVVCPEHFEEMREARDCRNYGVTDEPCEICLVVHCPGPGFCQYIYCGYCNSL